MSIFDFIMTDIDFWGTSSDLHWTVKLQQIWPYMTENDWARMCIDLIWLEDWLTRGCKLTAHDFQWLSKSHQKSIGPEYLALKSNFGHMTADDRGMTFFDLGRLFLFYRAAPVQCEHALLPLHISSGYGPWPSSLRRTSAPWASLMCLPMLGPHPPCPRSVIPLCRDVSLRNCPLL